MLREKVSAWKFPFLMGRAFIEASGIYGLRRKFLPFPFLLGRAFIEAHLDLANNLVTDISLPSWRGFH